MNRASSPPGARAREALALAARDCKAFAATADDNHSVTSYPFVTDNSCGGGGDLPGAMLLHEAAALFNLHSQAVFLQSIRSLIPDVLDVNSDSYSRWRE